MHGGDCGEVVVVESWPLDAPVERAVHLDVIHWLVAYLSVGVGCLRVVLDVDRLDFAGELEDGLEIFRCAVVKFFEG